MHSIVSMSHRGALLTRQHRATARIRLKRFLQTLLAIALGGEAELVDHVEGNAHDRRAGNGPAHMKTPWRIIEFLAKHLLVAHYGENKDGLQWSKTN